MRRSIVLPGKCIMEAITLSLKEEEINAKYIPVYMNQAPTTT